MNPTRVAAHNVYPDGHLAPSVSGGFLTAYFALLLVCAAVLLLRSIARGKLARRADRAADDHRPLGAGPTVVYGTVEYAAGETQAVKVEVDQKGTEQESSGSWSHKWTEVDRRTTVTPFYLRRDETTRIRVEPPQNVRVADDLDGKVFVRDNFRTRFAELKAGEGIYAKGMLERATDEESEVVTRGYRGARRDGWRLTGGDAEDMLLSSHRLGKGYADRKTFHAQWFWAVVAVAIVTVISSSWYLNRQVFGATAVGKVAQLRHYIEENDDSKNHVWECTIAVAGQSWRQRLDEDDWHTLTEGDHVFARVGSRSAQMGRNASLHGVAAFLLSGLWVALFAYYRVRRAASQPWYRRKLLQSGSGRLRRRG